MARGKRDPIATTMVLSVAAIMGLASGVLVGGIQTGSTVQIVIAAVIYLLGVCAIVALRPKIRRRQSTSK
ncbi:hypothetical protein PUR22_21320 [Mycolicibacterium porcinum]|uniref:hypothetical protein n=1 Tax=Mycolicibacterium porcinum TaxID=39693 RepID=UPI0031F9D8B2